MRFLLLFLFFFDGRAFADSASDLERFEVWLKILEKPLASSNQPEKVVEALLAEPRSRIAAFNIQALGRLYESLDPQFGFLKRDFKSIEDGLGAIDKWKKIENQNNLKKSLKSFAQTLETEKWLGSKPSSKINKIRKTLQKNIDELGDTRNALLQKASDQLHAVESANYDFSKLETGFGLHEFRRQIRWFMIEAQVLNGLINFKDTTSCPVESFNDLMQQPIAKSKYAILRSNPNEATSCAITPCYFVALADVVERIGLLKDQAELAIGNTDSDDTPEKIKTQAEEIKDQLLPTGVFSRLQSELNQCVQ